MATELLQGVSFNSISTYTKIYKYMYFQKILQIKKYIEEI